VLDPEQPGVHVDRATAGIVAQRFELEWHEHSATVVRHTDDERSPLVLGKATPTVGRDAEVAQLVALLASVEENGVPRIAIVEGTAGMGKSRVRREVTRSWVSRCDRVCLTAAFEPDSMRSSWAGFARAIRVFCGIRVGQPLNVQREQLALLAQRARLSDRAETFLAEVARTATPGDIGRLSAARSSPELMREGVQDAMESLLRGLAGDLAVLLVLEDAHWADPASLDLVGALAALPDLPLAVTAFARPTLLAAQPDLWSLRTPLRLHLPPLSIRAAGKLVRSVLPEATAQRVVSDVVELAAGNPLVLEELVRVVADRGEIVATDTARAVFEARVGLLHGEERVVARAAAVVGEVFWEAAVAALVEGSNLDVASALAALERREVITRRGGSRYEGQPDFSFRHALVRDAALAMVPEDASVVLHGRLARWLVSVGELDAAVIAAHAEAGGLSEMAGEMYVKAGHAALAAQDLPTAAALFDKVGAFVPRSDMETRWGLDLALESLCRELALDRRRVRHLAGLRRAARIRGDARMRAIALTREARFRCDRNEHHDGVSLGIEAVRLAREVSDPTLLAEAAIWTSLSAREASTAEEDHAVLDEALSAPGVPAHHRALLFRTRGTISRRRGRAQDAVTDYQVALSLCDEVGSRTALAESLCALSYATYVWGELSRARGDVDRALQVRKTIGSRLDVAKLLANHGNVCIAVGDWSGAARWIEASLVEHRRGVDPEAHVDSIILRARCYVETGEFGAAAECLEEAERRLTGTRANYDFAHLELVRGWLEARRSTWDHALARFDGCRNAASLGGAAALLAVGDGWRARALAELDRNDEARAGARDALRQLEVMDASEWAGETFFAIAKAQLRADPECIEGTLARARRWVNDFEERIGDEELRERFRERADVRWLRGDGG
jgi:tetratricopeptide (TPR) repeat protein